MGLAGFLKVANSSPDKEAFPLAPSVKLSKGPFMSYVRLFWGFLELHTYSYT